MKVLVTGCSGYVGSALLERLVSDPSNDVIGVDRIEPANAAHGQLRFFRSDLAQSDESLSGPMFEGIEAVLHLAAARGDWAISTDEYWRDNLVATQSLLKAPWAHGVPHWIFMSSVSTFGPAEGALDEDAPCRPIGAYGQSKLASELAFRDFIQAHGLRGCAIRPSAIFSAGHPANTNVYKLIESLRGLAVPLINGGANRKTLTYLPNLLDLVFWCLERMRSGAIDYRTYNYVEEPVQSVRDLIETLKAEGVQPARTFSIPLGLAIACAYPFFAVAKLVGTDLGVTPERVRKYAASTWYDATRVRRDGFSPDVSLVDALKITARWHLTR